MNGFLDGLAAAVNTQLFIDIGCVALDGRGGEVEPRPYLLVAEPLRQQGRDLELSLRKRLNEGPAGLHLWLVRRAQRAGAATHEGGKDLSDVAQSFLVEVQAAQ